ncbi:segregation/condensation protein A [candidate division KSB1 bacterium]|nr:segregation/condensation protein A [candidate division KSB1 bacterium]
MSYKVKLENFEGPLDLLLFLIKKEEVDIYNIPIARITQQYLQYLEIIQLLDLESASDFILMAATLMRIKAQMLLPKPSIALEQEDIEDPRQELVQRLLEYQRYKDVANDLGKKEQVSARHFPRGSFRAEEDPEMEIEQSSEVSLFDLVAAFKTLIDQANKVPVHRVAELSVTLEQCMATVQKSLSEKRQVRFTELFKPDVDRIVWIVTFIAILELIRLQVVRAVQEQPFAEIIISKIHA